MTPKLNAVYEMGIEKSVVNVNFLPKYILYINANTDVDDCSAKQNNITSLSEILSNINTVQLSCTWRIVSS